MHLRFYINEETDLPHIYDHGVREHEVEEVLHDPIREAAGYNESTLAYGKTLGGRNLKVVFKEDPRPGSFFVITAYPIEGKALKALRRIMRKKG